MTTPIVDIPMPYGVTVEGDGASKDAKIVGSHPMQDSASYLNLPTGPTRIAVSWEGPEEMRCYVYNRGPRSGRVVATIPSRSGGGGAFCDCSGRGSRRRHGQTVLRLDTSDCRSAGHDRGLSYGLDDVVQGVA